MELSVFEKRNLLLQVRKALILGVEKEEQRMEDEKMEVFNEQN